MSKVFLLSIFCTVLCFLQSTALYADAVLRDPTEPASSEEEGAKEKEKRGTHEYVLEAILVSGADKFAIINNKRVKEGDTIGTSKVKKIDFYEVILVGETGETVLALFGDSIKKPVKEAAK